MHDIFISYSRRDIERMQEVRDYLRESGLTVWTDEGIEPGTISWKTALSNAISDCTCVVVLFSPDSAQSTWVNRELDFAELHQKKIYPLLVSGEPKDALPFGYTTFQFIDIRNEDKIRDNLQRLVNSLQGDFPDRQLSATKETASPEIKSAESSQSANLIESVPNSTGLPKINWKPVETEHLNMFVPSTWKISEPTNEHWARTLLLMFPDKNRVYQMIQDEMSFGKILSPVPGTRIERDMILSDMTGLSPITGFFMVVRLPRIVKYGTILAKPLYGILLNNFSHRVADYWEKIGQMKPLSQESLAIHAGLCTKYVWINETHIAHNYLIFPNINSKAIWIQIVGDKERMESETDIFERMAKSVHFM